MRKTQGLGSQRAVVTEDKIRSWFKEAESCFAEEGIHVKEVPPECFFNFNESVFPFNTYTRHVLAAKEDKQVYSITSDTKQQITVLSCGMLLGNS